MGYAFPYELPQPFPFPERVPSTYVLPFTLSNVVHIDFSPCSLLTVQSGKPETLKSRSSFYSFSKQAGEKEWGSEHLEQIYIQKAVKQIYSFKKILRGRKHTKDVSFQFANSALNKIPTLEETTLCVTETKPSCSV